MVLDLQSSYFDDRFVSQIAADETDDNALDGEVAGSIDQDRRNKRVIAAENNQLLAAARFDGDTF